MAGAVLRLLAISLAIVAAGSCAPSADDIKKEFDEFVSTANQCTAASECTVASVQCPLGCFVSVRADRKADVEAKGRSLVAAYQRGGARCDYDCIGAGAPTCVDHRCATAPAP
jgi:hypothetical protein